MQLSSHESLLHSVFARKLLDPQGILGYNYMNQNLSPKHYLPPILPLSDVQQSRTDRMIAHIQNHARLVFPSPTTEKCVTYLPCKDLPGLLGLLAGNCSDNDIRRWNTPGLGNCLDVSQLDPWHGLF